MFNFGSSFGSSRNGQNFSLGQLLSSANVSLMRCLDNDSFISQFRYAPTPIKEYMTYKKWQQLVELVTEVGDPYDKKRSYKFPLTAADLLSSENSFVFDKLLPEQGVIIEQEKVITSVQQEIEQQVDDDEEEEEKGEDEVKKQVNSQVTVEKTEQKGEIGQDEQFGEFVEAPIKKKKIVKVKEVIETVTIIKKQYPSLINKILDYFNSEINYTLTSYCCKILTSLLNKRTSKFLTFFFETYSNSNRNIFKHIGSRSTVELLTRIFTIQTKEHVQNRVKLFQEFVVYSSQPHQLQILSNISATLCETFDKLNIHLKSNNPCKELQVYFNLIPQILPSIVSNIIGQHENVSVYSVPFLFQLLNFLPQELDNESIDKILQIFVEGAISKLAATIQSKKDRIGVGRVKLIEIFNFILKRSKIKQYVSIQQAFFPLLFSLVKTYPLNNILHNQTFKFITNFISTETQHQYAENALISWLKEQAQAQKQRIQSGLPKKSKGYNGHLFNLLKNIKETNNSVIKEFTLSLSYFDIVRILTEKETSNHQRNLGGFSTRKPTKFLILFSKEEILRQHAKFLSSSKPPTFEVDPDDPYQNLKEIEQLQRQLDGVQINGVVTSTQQEVKEQERHKAELIEENAQNLSAFWKVHLEYDIDSLMQELS